MHFYAIILCLIYKEKISEMTKFCINLAMTPFVEIVWVLQFSMIVILTYLLDKNLSLKRRKFLIYFLSWLQIVMAVIFGQWKKLSNIFCLQWMKEILALKVLQVIIWHQIWDLLQNYDKIHFTKRKNGKIKRDVMKLFLIASKWCKLNNNVLFVI